MEDVSNSFCPTSTGKIQQNERSKPLKIISSQESPALKKIPCPSLVQVAAALPTHLKPPLSVTDQPETLRIRPAPQRLRLKQHAISASQ